MHLVNSTTEKLRIILLLSFSMTIIANTYAQENSPYSRYGMGDLMPGQNITNRGMGGISAAYSDYGIIGSPFNINLVNPASLGNITNSKNFSNTLFDLGLEVDVRTLKSTNNTDKYKATNAVISYLQIAFPISSKKMEKKSGTHSDSRISTVSRIYISTDIEINRKFVQNPRVLSSESSHRVSHLSENSFAEF